MATSTIDILISAKDMATKSIAKVNSEIHSLGNTSLSVGKSMGGFASTVGSSLMTLGKVGGVALAWLGAYGIKTAGDFEQTSIAFTTMLGDGEKAGALLKDLSTFAASTPFEFPEIANAGKSLLAFGIEAKNIKWTLTTLGDVASSLNIPIGELSDIYGKIKTSGRVFSEDINQLTGRGIPVIAELAKQFGVGESEVRKLVESGKVWFPEIQKAMESMSGEGGKFAGGMQKQSESLQGLFSTAKDWLGNIINEIIGINQKGEVAKGSILEGAKTMLTGLIDFLNKNTENIKAFFEEVKTTFTNAFGAIFEIVKFFLDTIQTFWKNNGDQIKATVVAITDSLVAFWKKYGDDIMIVLNAVGFIFARAFDGIKLVVQSVMFIIGPLIKDVMTAIGGAFQIVAGILSGDFSKAWEGVKDLISGIVQVLGDIVLAFVDLVARAFGSDIISTINGTMDFLVQKAGQAKKLVDDILSATAKAGQNFTIQGALGLNADFSKKVDGARADGGPVRSGGTYLVGERGPELFTPSRSGTITPNGGGSPISININLGGVSVRNDSDRASLIREMQNELTRTIQLYKLGIS